MLAILFCGAAFSASAYAETLHLDAGKWFKRSVTENVVVSKDAASLELASGELIEDDGPAAGYSYKPTAEKLSDTVWIKKDFVLDRVPARGANLLVARGGDLKLAVNGTEITDLRPRQIGHHWHSYAIDPKLLHSGTNEFVLHGSGQVWVALDEDYDAGSLTRTRHPNRSAKSRDGGKTWDYEKLGPGDDLDGEYNVRLFLDRYLPSGRITSPVIDLGNLDERPIGHVVESIASARLAIDADTPRGSRLDVRYRSGTTFVVGDKLWSDWREADQLTFNLAPRGRYVQFEIALFSDDPLVSPQVRGATITAETKPADDWTDRLKLTGSENPLVVRSCVPFEYEPFDQPLLAKMRMQYKLDDVVRGAKSEMELIEKLAAWSSQRWPKIGHLGQAYPAWDACTILAPHEDGTPIGGFCLQFNLVFLQACESFGIPGRVLSIGSGEHIDRIRGGHEVVEVWSNEYRKWMYVDGNTAWYLVDAQTGVPLSLWELRQRQLDAWEGKQPAPLRVVKLAETRFEWKGLSEWPPLVELRLVPRSNFLAQKSPLPLNQGMRGWFWTGHYVWTDDRLPAREIYSQRLTRRANFEWSLNQAQIVLEPTATPGQVRAHLDSNTPGLESYLAAIDDGERKPTGAILTWKLHEGANRLSIIPRNFGGREGIESRIEWEIAR